MKACGRVLWKRTGRGGKRSKPGERLELPVEDVSGEEEGERRAREELERECRRPFDLERGPLLRCRLWKLEEKRHWLLCNMHHIISDGWSLGVLIREMNELYGSLREGKASALPELPIQYADYAVWQRQWLQGETLQRLLHFWKLQLADCPQMLPLPADRPRSALQSYAGARLPFSLSQELSDQIYAITRTEGVTLFITLLSAFQTLLYAYTEEQIIPVCTGIANRSCTELEKLIG